MSTKPSASINLGLPAAPEVDSPELYSSLLPVYNAIRNVLYALDSYTGNTLITASEYDQVPAYSQILTQKTAVLYVKLAQDVTNGQILNLFDSGGLRAQKALAGTSRGHCFSLASGVTGQHIPVCLLGICSGIGGLSIGSGYYLSSTVAGAVTNTVTSQRLGFAVDTNKLWFNPE